MGQKINPLKLRTYKPLLSKWHSKHQYTSCLQYDLLLRQGIEKILQKKAGPLYVSWSGFGIQTGFTRLSDNTISPYKICQTTKKSVSKRQNLINSSKQLHPLKAVHRAHGWWVRSLSAFQIHSPYQSAQTLVSTCVSQIEDGKNVRIIFDQLLKGAQKSEWVQGIKIRIAGRIQGKEIARTQTKRWGILRLHTIRQGIDFAKGIARTRAGIIGVQVWISLRQNSSIER